MQYARIIAEATDIPEGVDADIEGLEEGAYVRAADLTLPAGVELEEDPETVVINISVPRVSEEDLEADAASAEAGAAAGEAGEAESTEGRSEERRVGKECRCRWWAGADREREGEGRETCG